MLTILLALTETSMGCAPYRLPGELVVMLSELAWYNLFKRHTPGATDLFFCIVVVGLCCVGDFVITFTSDFVCVRGSFSKVSTSQQLQRKVRAHTCRLATFQGTRLCEVGTPQQPQ